MKRFKVSNIFGQNFAPEGESLNSIYGDKLPTEWGKPAWTETKVTPAVLDGEGKEISPEVIEEINHPAEYSIVEEDISAEVAAKEKKIKDKNDLKPEVETILNKSGNLTTAELTKVIRFLLG